MKLKLAFLLILCPFFQASAQALKPGDKLAAAMIDGINPADYRDNLLILDFWASSCASCIESMPKLAAIQKRYGGRVKILLIAYEKPERITRFLAARPDLISLGLPIIAHDTTLSKIFVHQYLPHVVWLYKGIYIKATGAEYVNPNSVDSVLNGKQSANGQKTDIIDFDYKQPLFSITANQQSRKPPLYTSAISGYINGLPLSAGNVTDSAGNSKRFYVINHSIVHLYALALKSSLPLQANRRILPDNHTYDYPSGGGYRAAWEQQRCYCYEFTGPEDTPDSLIKHKMLSDLDQYLGLCGRIETRKVPCFLLEGKPKTSTAERVIRRESSGHYTVLQHITAADLVYILTSKTVCHPYWIRPGQTTALTWPLLKRQFLSPTGSSYFTQTACDSYPQKKYCPCSFFPPIKTKPI